jgi:hypothetical protein
MATEDKYGRIKNRVPAAHFKVLNVHLPRVTEENNTLQ